MIKAVLQIIVMIIIIVGAIGLFSICSAIVNLFDPDRRNRYETYNINEE